MNIFIGNLSFEAKEPDVNKAFAFFGKVDSVAIVMDKNGKKSRGFGFVEMPNEEEALAAIAALEGKEILGRPVNVMPALPKKQKSERKDYKKSGSKDELVYRRTGKYKEGRRTLSYMKRRMSVGITAPVVERKFKANPMRWRKKSKWATPYQKPEGGSKPWIKSESSRSRPWKKPEGEPKPWIKSESSRSRPWKKAEGEPKPWKKPEGVSKPWRKSSGDLGKLRSTKSRDFVKRKR